MNLKCITRINKTHAYDFMYRTFWKRQNHKDRKQISGCQWVGVEGGFVYKEVQENLWAKWNVLNGLSWWFHNCILLSKFVELYTNQNNTTKWNVIKVVPKLTTDLSSTPSKTQVGEDHFCSLCSCGRGCQALTHIMYPGE